MRYLVAVDVGIKNLGLCVFDFVSTQFVFWDNVSLVPNGRYMPCQNVQYVRDFCKRYAEYFDNAAAVCLDVVHHFHGFNDAECVTFAN